MWFGRNQLNGGFSAHLSGVPTPSYSGVAVMLLAFVVAILAGPPIDSESASSAPRAVAPAVESRRPIIFGNDRGAAVNALEELSLAGGEGALEAIADFIDRWKGDPEMPRHGHSALRRLPVDATALSHVITTDAAAHRRAWAAWTAGEHRTSGVADALLGGLKDPDAKVRLRCVAALAVIGDPRAQDPIMRIRVHDPDPSTRELAEQALAVLLAPRVDPEPIEPLIAALASTDIFVRLASVKQLEEKRPDRRAVGALLALLEKERDLEVRKHAIGALASIKDEIAVPAVIKIAQTDHAEVRTFAIGTLAVLDDSRAVEPLVALCGDGNFQVRRYSLRALAMMRRPASLAPLVRGVEDSVAEVRSEAVKGLVRISARDAGADALAARLSRESDPSLREFFAVTLGDLGTIGNVAHENALLKLLEDDDLRVRGAAAGALGKIGTSRTEKAILRMLEKERKKKEKDLDVIRLGEEAAIQVRTRKSVGDGG